MVFEGVIKNYIEHSEWVIQEAVRNEVNLMADSMIACQDAHVACFRAH